MPNVARLLAAGAALFTVVCLVLMVRVVTETPPMPSPSPSIGGVTAVSPTVSVFKAQQQVPAPDYKAPPAPTRSPLAIRSVRNVDTPEELVRRPFAPYRKFVFVASTGYSGTKAFAALLNTATDVTCFHERAPGLVDFPHLLRDGFNKTYKSRAESKLGAITKDLAAMPPRQTYCDTSHMFIKSFSDVFLDKAEKDGNEVHVIVLRRYLPLVLRSAIKDMYKAWPPSRPLPHYSGGEYVLHHRNYAILDPLYPTPDAGDSVDLALGYFIDNEAQVGRLRAQYPFVHFHEFRAEAMEHMPSVRSLFTNLGIGFSNATLKAVLSGLQTSRVANHHASTSLKSAIPLEGYRFRVLQYLELRRAQGLSVPPLPQMLPFKVTPAGDVLSLPLPLIGPAELEAMRATYMPLFDNLTTVQTAVHPVRFSAQVPVWRDAAGANATTVDESPDGAVDTTTTLPPVSAPQV